jgi:hypothetical protein
MSSEKLAEIRYLREGANVVVKDDDGSRQKSRDQITSMEMVPMRSARELSNSHNQLQTRGFCLTQFDSKNSDKLAEIQNPIIYRNEKTPETATSRQIRLSYQSECEELIKQLTGAKYCYTISHACRTGKPRATGAEYLTAYATFAHCDYTDSIFAGAPSMLRKRGVPDAESGNLDVAFFNIWQPVGREVYQHPLAMLDWTTVSPTDIQPVSLGYNVTPTRNDSKKNTDTGYSPMINQLYHSNAHQW